MNQIFKPSRIVILTFILLTSGLVYAQSWTWANRAGGTSTDTYPRGATVDDHSNAYWGGTIYGNTVTIGIDTLNVGNDRVGTIAQYDSTGILGWHRQFTASSGDVIVQDLEYYNGFIYACGSFENTTNFGNGIFLDGGNTGDAFLVKMDTIGNTIWVRKGGISSQPDEATGVAIDEFGDVYITGVCTSWGTTPSTFNQLIIPIGFREIFVVKYDSNGNALWAKSSTGTVSDDKGQDITCDKGGGIYVTGDYEQAITFGGLFPANPVGWHSLFLVKLDYSGNFDWTRQIVCPRESKGVAIDADTLGNVFVSATIDGTYYGIQDTIVLSNSLRYFNLNFDYNGNIQYELQSSGRGIDIEADNRGSVYLFGSTYGSASWMAKLGANGQQKWIKNSGGASSDYGLTGAVDPNSDYIYQGGYFYTYITFGPAALWDQGNNDLYFAQLNDDRLDGSVFVTGACLSSCDGIGIAQGLKGSPPYTYQWSNGSTNDTVSNLCAGPHSVTIKDALLDSIVINVTVQTLSSFDTLVSVNELLLTAASGYNYEWYLDGDTIPLATDLTYNVLANGTYSALLTDSNGCSTFSEEIIINYNCDSVEFNILSTTVCQLDSLSGTVFDSLSMAQFEWVVAGDVLTGNSLSWYADTSGTMDLIISITTPLCIRDSVIQIEIHPTYSILNSIQICQGDSVLISGNYENATGQYFDLLQTVNGCDSVIENNLTVEPISTEIVDYLSVCEGDSLLIFGVYQSTPDIYFDTLQSVSGCDSLIGKQLSINVLPTVTLAPFLLDTLCNYSSSIPLPIGSPSSGTYSGNGVNGTDFDPTSVVSGSHTITYEFTDLNGCSNSASSQIVVDGCAGYEEGSSNFEILFYPNPVNTVVVVSIVDLAEPISYEIINALGITIKEGELINSETLINVSVLPAGTYFIKFSNSDSNVQRFVKN